eukprot:gnl/Carplike_NY0171/3505_a4735_256.p1 GENE.gnl/Carplike_NY0171/3505_a4735_256~~gnl/Carplike_NY0171/3505_a4735_256.p1  ORF type:complete len:274 (-),score=55.57 gnl/Carplike_NY0171/3505_a4735_256:319-1113(-)
MGSTDSKYKGNSIASSVPLHHVEINFVSTSAREVKIRGYTRGGEWNDYKMSKISSETFKLSLELPKGLFFYNFIVDGKTVTSGDHSYAKDPVGNVRNYMRVGESREKTADKHREIRKTVDGEIVSQSRPTDEKRKQNPTVPQSPVHQPTKDVTLSAQRTATPSSVKERDRSSSHSSGRSVDHRPPKGRDERFRSSSRADMIPRAPIPLEESFNLFKEKFSQEMPSLSWFVSKEPPIVEPVLEKTPLNILPQSLGDGKEMTVVYN